MKIKAQGSTAYKTIARNNSFVATYLQLLPGSGGKGVNQVKILQVDSYAEQESYHVCLTIATKHLIPLLGGKSVELVARIFSQEFVYF